MVQTLLTYGLVAIAAVWVVWAVFLPRTIKRSLKARFGSRRAAAGPHGDKGGCDCGDGGCGG